MQISVDKCLKLMALKTNSAMDVEVRLCGDYSTNVNKYLEPHRGIIRSVDDMLKGLKGKCGFTKIDLTSAYNQVVLSEKAGLSSLCNRQVDGSNVGSQDGREDEQVWHHPQGTKCISQWSLNIRPNL